MTHPETMEEPQKNLYPLAPELLVCLLLSQGFCWSFSIMPCALITIPAASKRVGYSSPLGLDKGASLHKGQPQPLSFQWNVVITN